jgi:hypothetical protein
LAFFNGGYKDKDGQSHYYPAMDVTMTMSDEGRDTYNKAALKETAFRLRWCSLRSPSLVFSTNDTCGSTLRKEVMSFRKTQKVVESKSTTFFDT